MATKNQISNRNKPKERGRTPKPAIGDYKSVIDSLQHSMDKNIAQIAKDLSFYYEALEKFAKAEAKFSKDQIMAIRWHIERAEKFLDEHYEVCDLEESSGDGSFENDKSSEGKSNGTNGLLVLDFDKN